MTEPASKKKKAAMARYLDRQEVKSWIAVLQCYKEVFTLLESHHVHDNCSISRYQILHNLYFDGPLAPSAIADRLTVTRGNISMFIRRMEGDGLVEPIYETETTKRPKYDLTSQGRDFFESLFPDHIRKVQEVFDPLDDETLERLKAIAERAHQMKIDTK